MSRAFTLPAAGICLVFLCVAPSSSQDASDPGNALQRSRDATKILLTTMRTLLSQQLAAGGTVRAIEVCADSAQVVGERIQQELGLSIRRVSLRWRNSKNTPDNYEVARLNEFAGMKQANALTDTSEFYQATIEDSIKTFRYMRPIFTGEMCLSCHGSRERMKDLIYSSIQQRYPNDKALEFKAGDLRGAVSVKIHLDE